MVEARRAAAWSLALIPVALSSGLIMTGCSATDQGAPAPTDSSTDRAPDFRSRDDLSDPVPIPWADAERVGPDRVRVRFQAGSPTCYGIVARAVETPIRVMIDVRQGRLPDAPAVCTLDAVQGTVVIALNAPVGDRAIVGHEGG